MRSPRLISSFNAAAVTVELIFSSYIGGALFGEKGFKI
jgi:hypothetical protein